MKKKLGLLSAVALFGSMLVPPMATARSNCDCWYVFERNAFGDIIGGHWECPTNPICQIEVTPEG